MCLHNWNYDLMLPGKWFSFNIMTALIRCRPGVTGEETPAAARFDCGLSLPEKSYWRIRIVLGAFSAVSRASPRSAAGWGLVHPLSPSRQTRRTRTIGTVREGGQQIWAGYRSVDLGELMQRMTTAYPGACSCKDAVQHWCRMLYPGFIGHEKSLRKAHPKQAMAKSTSHDYILSNVETRGQEEKNMTRHYYRRWNSCCKKLF
jgi:hypothetical protein